MTRRPPPCYCGSHNAYPAIERAMSFTRFQLVLLAIAFCLTAVNAARIFLRTAEVKFPSFADLGVALMSPFLADGLGVSGLARVSAGR